MFQKLRNKVNSVLPDIENHLQNISNAANVPSPLKTINQFSGFTTSTTASNTASASSTLIATASVQWPNTKAINFNAGCALLQRNEEIWKEIHAANESNARKAAESDRLILGIKESVTKHDIDLNDINVSLEQMPQIIRTVENCSAIVMDINQKCSAIEDQLFELEDLMEILELQEKQLDRRFEMALFKERKLADLEKVRQNLAVKHAASVRDCEKQMRSVQLERQAVFQDAFQRDMDYYKEVGSIPKIENNGGQQKITLDEVVLDDGPDVDELDKFLRE